MTERTSQFEHEEAVGAVDRAGCLLMILDRVSSAVELMQLVDILGLEGELELLAGDTVTLRGAERHRRIQAARVELELKLGELEPVAENR
jgi:hypothetical protein